LTLKYNGSGPPKCQVLIISHLRNNLDLQQNTARGVGFTYINRTIVLPAFQVQVLICR